MQDFTNEFSFILKPSKHGVGVFTVHGIKAGTYLQVFSNEERTGQGARRIDKEKVPETLKDYCIDRGDQLACPTDFSAMSIGWYMNHSKTPNAAHKNYRYYAMRDIEAGEEILIDYNTLEESEDAKDDYYKS